MRQNLLPLKTSERFKKQILFLFLDSFALSLKLEHTHTTHTHTHTHTLDFLLSLIPFLSLSPFSLTLSPFFSLSLYLSQTHSVPLSMFFTHEIGLNGFIECNPRFGSPDINFAKDVIKKMLFDLQHTLKTILKVSYQSRR